MEFIQLLLLIFGKKTKNIIQKTQTVVLHIFWLKHQSGLAKTLGIISKTTILKAIHNYQQVQ